MAGQLAASPMMIFAVWIENALDVPVQCPHDADARQHQPAATDLRGVDQVFDRGLPLLELLFGPGSFWIYLAASLSVTSWRPRGNGIGSSNSRAQPRLLMSPSLLVEFGLEPFRHPRC